MSVTGAYAPVREAGNGSKVAFDFTFKVQNTSDLVVSKVLKSTDAETVLTEGVDYTVALSTTTDGGTVTYTVAPTTLQDSLIYMEVPITQTAVIPTNGVFREVQIENALDRGTLIDQQLQEQIDRCVKLPIADSSSVIDLAELAADVAAAGEAKADAETAQAAAEAAQAAAEAAQASVTAIAAGLPTLLSILQTIYYVGSTHVSYDSTNPAIRWGFGTWALCGVGRVWVGINSADTDFDTVAEQGGEKTHTLTTDEVPALSITTSQGYDDSSFSNNNSVAKGDTPSYGSMTTSNGAGGAHNNLPPYEVVYKWRRTA